MPAFPAPDSLTYLAGRHNSDVGVLLDGWAKACRQLSGADNPAALTIAAGALNPTEAQSKADLIVDTEAAAATDDLDRLNPANYPNGAIVTFASASATRDVTLRHSQGGTGFLFNLDGLPIVLSDTSMAVAYRLSVDRLSWRELSRSYGTNSAGARSAMGLQATATWPTATQAEAITGTAANRAINPANLIQALNGRRPPPYVSADITIADGANGSFTHGSGGEVPWRVTALIRCDTAELGYSVGQFLKVPDIFLGSQHRGVQTFAGPTIIGYSLPHLPQPIALLTASAGTPTLITNARWKLLLVGSFDPAF